MNYEEAVAEGRRLVKRSEEDQWRLAQLTWEQISASVPRSQWARDTGISAKRVNTFVRLWEEWREEAAANRPPFSDAYNAIADPARVGQVQEHARAEAVVRNLPTERKAEVARELLDEPEVAARVFSRTRQVPPEELRKAYERVPEVIRDESLGAPTGVSTYLSGIREYLRLIHELATNPRVNWEGYRGAVSEELHRIARQAEGLAEIIEDPAKGQATDEALEQLLRDAR